MRMNAFLVPRLLSLWITLACTPTGAFVPLARQWRDVVATVTTTTSSSPSWNNNRQFQLFAIVDEVSDQMKTAMKAKDQVKLNTIRLIRAAFANAAIEAKTGKLSDEQAIDVIRKMAKMRKESIDMFTQGGATDRAEAEQAELDVMSQWLPSLADEDQTRIWVQEAIAEAQSNGDANIGKVMGALMKAHKGEVDGSLAQKLVKEEVAKL